MKPKAKEKIISGFPPTKYNFTGEWQKIELGANSNIAKRNRAIAEVPVYRNKKGEVLLDMTQRITIKRYRGK